MLGDYRFRYLSRMGVRPFAVFAILLLLLAACGSPGVDEPEDTPTATPTDGDATPEPTEEGDQEVTAFFARIDDSGAWVEPETHTVTGETEAVARAAMEFLVAASPRNPNLVNTVPEGTEVLDVTLSDGLLTIDLSEEVRGTGHGSAEELAFAQQLAHTGGQFDTVDAVRLLVEGEEVSDLWGHVDWSEPVEPDLFALTPITIERPHWGETLAAGSVTAAGQANVFEANVLIRLIDPDGTVVEDTFTTATSGSGERGTWEHTFDAPADTPGTWTIEAEEPDPSAGEGRPPLVTRIEFEIT